MRSGGRAASVRCQCRLSSGRELASGGAKSGFRAWGGFGIVIGNEKTTAATLVRLAAPGRARRIPTVAGGRALDAHPRPAINLTLVAHGRLEDA
jgi:hypothetical protein